MYFLKLPSLERVKELLIYDPETGLFFWKKVTSNVVSMGDKAGGPNSKGYIQICIDGKSFKAHRLAWLLSYGEDPGNMEIDHIDRNRGNNKRSNLRLASVKQNRENIGTPRHNTSGFRGVSQRTDTGVWVAYIYHNKAKLHIGTYKTFQEAADARMLYECTLFTHSDRITAIDAIKP